MKRNALFTALALAAFAGCDAGDKDGGGYQEVRMDEGEGASTVVGAEEDRYGDAAVGTVGTDADPAVVTGDGREGPDTVHQAGGAAGAADTIR